MPIETTTMTKPTISETPPPPPGVRLLWPVLLAVGMMAMVVLPILATTGLDNTPINLSKRAGAGLKSADPDLEASPDGEWVAVVWSLGYNNRSDTAELGHIVLKSANVITGWEMQVRPYTATSTVWGQQPRMVLPPVAGSGYQAAVTWVECQNQDEQCDTIKMAICDLSTYPDTCQPAQTVHSAPGSSLSNPDIAYDDSGDLHIIWKQGTGDAGLWYQRAGGNPSRVPATTANSYNPSLIWSSGNGADRLHLVWYEYHDTPESRRIKYSADTNLANDAWDAGSPAQWKARLSYRFTGDIGEPYIKPTIAATSTHVYIAWDMYKMVNYQDQFHLAYEHSSNNGTTWVDNGGDGEPIPGPFYNENTTYRSPLSSIDEESTLRPSIAISGTLPAIAWHFSGYASGENAVYLIGYRYSISNPGISWTDPLTMTQDINYDPADGVDEDDSANPDVALWPGGKVHIGYMGLWGGNPYDDNSDWDIYCRGVAITDTSTAASAPTAPTPGGPTPTTDPYDDLHRAPMPLIMKN